MPFFKNYFKGIHKPGGIVDLLALAFPMMISTACDGVMTFTDRLFLARLGSDQMNAAMGGFVSYQMLILFFVGLAGYSTALVAQYYGAGQKTKAPVATFHAILIVLVAWPIVILLKPLVIALFFTMDLPSTQVGFQVQYLNILIWGSIFTMIRQTMGCYFTGIGKAKVVMNATLLAMIVNVFFAYILIFGKLGFEPMGVDGAAIATVLGNAGAMIYFLVAYFKPVNSLSFEIRNSFRYDADIMKRLLRYGYPAGLEIFLCFLAFFFMTGMFQAQGQSASTATSIMFSYDLVSYIPLLGIEIATTSLAGRYMGAGRPQVAHRVALSAIKTGLVYSTVILIVFLFIPESLVRVFHPSAPSPVFEAAVPMAKMMIRIASLYVLAQAVMVALVGTLRGAGDTFYTMMVSVGANWLFLPLQFLALYVLKTSVPVGWLILVLVYLSFCFVMYRRFRTEKWKKLRIIQ
jgi:multidrug resistance protein, MATE family